MPNEYLAGTKTMLAALLLGVDFNILTSTPEEYEKMLRADISTFTRVAKETGLRAR
jgi:hypothetical protein